MPVPAPRNCRILVVEDEFIIAMDLEIALQAAQAIILDPVPSVLAGLDPVAAIPCASPASGLTTSRWIQHDSFSTLLTCYLPRRIGPMTVW